jgi:hypothetical protein
MYLGRVFHLHPHTVESDEQDHGKARRATLHLPLDVEGGNRIVFLTIFVRLLPISTTSGASTASHVSCCRRSSAYIV